MAVGGLSVFVIVFVCLGPLVQALLRVEGLLAHVSTQTCTCIGVALFCSVWPLHCGGLHCTNGEGGGGST